MQAEQQELSEALTAESVAKFLTTNPEFFNQHSEVLPRLAIPHHTGEAVSLIEKQVSVLRNKCFNLENSLHDLITVARENEQLHQRLNTLIQEIISAKTLDEVIGLTRDSLLVNFNADDVKVVLFAASDSENDNSDYTFIDAEHEKIALFNNVFEKRETQCGPLDDAQKALVFNDNAEDVASAAVIPLVHERKLGLVALPSKDETRFARGKGVMFLNQLGEVLSRRVDTLV